MDSSHVALVTFYLRADAFLEFHLERNMSLGLSVANVAKVMKCGENNDSLSIQANENNN